MRTAVFEAVRAATEPHAWAITLWEGGSAAFDRLDADSDMDLGLAVEEGHVADGFAAVEAALASVSPIVSRWHAAPCEDPKPQRYYRLATGLMIDLGVLPTSTPPLARYLDRARHGTPRIAYDKADWTADVPIDPVAHAERLRERRAFLRDQVGMLGGLCLRSVRRGEPAEAVAFYQAFVLRPIVELLRMRHDPLRFDFGVRYLRFDVPEPARSRVYRLWMVGDLDALVCGQAEALAWFQELADPAAWDGR